MNFNEMGAVLSLVRRPGALGLFRDATSALRLDFLYAALGCGLLEALRAPRTQEELVEALRVQRPDLLAALLDLGVSVGELRLRDAHYRLAGSRSRALIAADGDGLAGLVEALHTYYNSVYREPRRGHAIDGRVLAAAGHRRAAGPVARSGVLLGPGFAPHAGCVLRRHRAGVTPTARPGPATLRQTSAPQRGTGDDVNHLSLRPLGVSLLAAFLLASTPAEPLSNRVSFQMAAWSEDGNDALMLELTDVPEGGGSLALWVISGREATGSRFLFSSDFGAGGRGPQKVSREECRRQSDALLKLVRQKKLAYGFDFSTLCGEDTSGGTGGPTRYFNVVSRGPAIPRGTKVDLTSYDDPERRGEWTATMRKDGVALEHAKGGKAFFKVPTEGTFFELRISPNGKLVLVNGELKERNSDTLYVYAGASLPEFKLVEFGKK